MRAGETLPGAGRKLVRTYALTPDLLAMSQVWATKGAGWQIAPRAPPRRWPICAGSMPLPVRR